MSPREREALNTAILEAHARGERPFCCFGCGDWFTETPPFGRGRPRVVCDDRMCRHLRARWTREGRWPTSADPAKLRGWQVDRARQPVKMLFEFAV